jgi:hypothetical protein
MTVQPSLLTLLDPINPRTIIDRIPGLDAPCICNPDRKESCGFPFCNWSQHLPEREAA